MRFSTAASAALAAAPLVAARGELGWAIGTKKADGTCKYQADYESDFDAISQNSGSKLVRGYDANDCNFAQQVLPAAKAKGFKVTLGVWPDTDESFNNGVNAIKSNIGGNEDAVYGITVGSETLYRKTFDGNQLLDKINSVKQTFPGTKVGTADSWNKFYDGTADAVIQGNVDYILVNAFGFWQGQDISNATATYFDDISKAYQHIQTIAGDKYDDLDLWTGETGWPSDGGSDYGAAKAGTQNAGTFYSHGICGAIKWGYNVFAFEAFDEPWKPDSIGDNGSKANEQHWGMMTADRTPKYPLQC